MLDLVPLAGSRRVVADGDGQLPPIRQPLQLHLPRSQARAVVAVSIGTGLTG